MVVPAALVCHAPCLIGHNFDHQEQKRLCLYRTNLIDWVGTQQDAAGKYVVLVVLVKVLTDWVATDQDTGGKYVWFLPKYSPTG